MKKILAALDLQVRSLAQTLCIMLILHHVTRAVGSGTEVSVKVTFSMYTP
jgi:hypothetical protein